MRIDDVKDILKTYNIRPSKRLSQHFLIDEHIAYKIIEHGNIDKEDVVLEVGPGLGILTKHIVKKAKRVIAVEQDKKFCSYLTNKFGDEIELINANALKINFPYFDKIISNLPYKISSPITFKFLAHDFQYAILMYQKEFADRMVAKKGKEYSRLSVNVYYRGKCERLEYVPKTAFYPQPKIDSAVVKLTPREPIFKVKDEALFFKVVETLFSHRRKKIQNSLLMGWKNFAEDKEAMKSIVQHIPYKDKRVEELSPEEIGVIADEIYREL